MNGQKRNLNRGDTASVVALVLRNYSMHIYNVIKYKPLKAHKASKNLEHHNIQLPKTKPRNSYKHIVMSEGNDGNVKNFFRAKSARNLYFSTIPIASTSCHSNDNAIQVKRPKTNLVRVFNMLLIILKLKV